MKEKIVHKVKTIGESEYTVCGVRCTNGTVVITQDGEFTCKRCKALTEFNGKVKQ